MTYTAHYPQKMARSGEYIRCETCSKEFYVCPARLRQTQQKGYRIRFCSQACYPRKGDKNPMHGRKLSAESIAKAVSHPNRKFFTSGPDNPNFSRFGADFEPKTAFRAKERALARAGGCERCGFNAEKGILEIHHKDRNRDNNARENLELLCPNCHALEHFVSKDGKFHRKTNRSTFRAGSKGNPGPRKPLPA